MRPHKSVADRLVDEARARAARSESPTPGTVAVLVGGLSVLVSPIPILGWALGATAVGLGVAAGRRPVTAERARIAIGLGVAAILIGIVFFALALASR